ncbi:dirigent protein 22-like [Salvia miltiorrhiza]|uniref:dirigent protein 22-like n=1 Tax=Salvia miltiorrhiza TaxID=226208 RepID=UPI0025AD2490|nr:dirigent protein 22-like [Salvia miltiorrhiza]
MNMSLTGRTYASVISELHVRSTLNRNKHTRYIEYAKEAEKWFRNVSQRKEKFVKLRLYIQDALGGPNATIWEVARAEVTAASPTSFGQVRVFDDLVTAEPDRNSAKLGRAQGLITSAGFHESAFAMNLNLVFMAGPYNGSTLSIAGRNPIHRLNRELPVVGGTGVFRMARGFSISNTYSYDPLQNYGVLEYVLYVSYV